MYPGTFRRYTRPNSDVETPKRKEASLPSSCVTGTTSPVSTLVSRTPSAEKAFSLESPRTTTEDRSVAKQANAIHKPTTRATGILETETLSALISSSGSSFSPIVATSPSPTASEVIPKALSSPQPRCRVVQEFTATTSIARKAAVVHDFLDG